VQLTRTGESTSLYGATVELPATGDWSVEVSSTEPNAEATQAIAVTEQAATASSTTVPATDGDTAGSDGTTTTAAEELDAEPVTTTAAAEEDEASSPNLTLIVGASLVLFAIVMVGAVLVARQRATKDAADEV
jgi:hypothetical protein